MGELGWWVRHVVLPVVIVWMVVSHADRVVHELVLVLGRIELELAQVVLGLEPWCGADALARRPTPTPAAGFAPGQFRNLGLREQLVGAGLAAGAP